MTTTYGYSVSASVRERMNRNWQRFLGSLEKFQCRMTSRKWTNKTTKSCTSWLRNQISETTTSNEVVETFWLPCRHLLYDVIEYCIVIYPERNIARKELTKNCYLAFVMSLNRISAGTLQIFRFKLFHDQICDPACFCPLVATSHCQGNGNS